jgi:hypothetical protein
MKLAGALPSHTRFPARSLVVPDFLSKCENVPVAITANKLTTAIGNGSKAISVSILENCGLRLHTWPTILP